MISITVGDTFGGAEYSRQTFICGAPAMGIEILAAFPALDHHEQIGVVDAGVTLIGETAFFLAGCRDACLGALDEGFPLVRFYLRGGDDVDHGLGLPLVS